MRALITGVTGFAGGHLAEHLIGRGDHVLGCSNTGDWLPESPAELAPRVPLLPWDLAAQSNPPVATLSAIRQFNPEVIYHLAAISIPAECGAEEPTDLAQAVNVGGTRVVLDLAAGLRPSPRVLLVSSSHVYSRVEADTPPIDESWPIAPRNAYGQTKWQAEQVAREYNATRGIDAVIVRAFQHCGPRQVGALMLPEWMAQCVAGTSPIKVYNCGASIDLSDVRDVVCAYRLAAIKGCPGGTYNVGSGVRRRAGDVLDLLLGLAGRRPIEEVQPQSTYDPIADCRRLAIDTGWRPQIPLEQTIADTLEWWRQRASASR
jgi:GDP-4-dehydro-6-deoxy-D-mannose reductase